MARNENQKTSKNNGSKKDKKDKKPPVVQKVARVRKHHGEVGVPDYGRGKLPKGFLPEKADMSAVLIEGGIAELISLPKDTKGVLVNVPDCEGRNATFYAVGGGFTKDDPDLGRKVVVEYVEVYLRNAEPGNAMHAYGKTLDGVFVTKSQIKVEVLNKSSTMPESTYKARLALHAYLHGAWVDAGCPQPMYVPSESADFVEVIRSIEVAPAQGGELTFAQLRDILAQPEEVLEQDRRKGATSRAQDFAKTINGRYYFPNKGPAVFLEIQNGVIAIEAIEEGHYLYESLKNYEGACFLFAQLNGSLPLPREVLKRSSPQGLALSNLIKALRRFLSCPAFGFKMSEDEPYSLNLLRKAGDLEVEKQGVYSWDNVDFRVAPLPGIPGQKMVEVLYVPEGYPEHGFLVQLMREGLYLPMMYVHKTDFSGDELPAGLQRRRKNLVALRSLVRRAMGLDGLLSLVDSTSSHLTDKEVDVRAIKSLKGDKSHTFVFEGISFRALASKNQSGRDQVRVFVLSVPDNHPDAKTLSSLGCRDYLCTYVVEKNDAYPIETVDKRTPGWKVQALEALFNVMSRIPGMRDSMPVSKTADKTSKGVKSA